MDIIEVLARAEAHPKKVFAVLSDGETITYGNLLATIVKLSLVFNNLNLKENDKILLSTSDKRSLAEITIAAYRLGVTVILLDPNAKAERIHSIIESAKPDAFFIDSTLREGWRLTKGNVMEINKAADLKKGLFKNIFSKNKPPKSDREK